MSEAPKVPTAMWIEGDPQPDTYAAFRGTLQLDADAEVQIRMWGASWFIATIDGDYAAAGPTRSEANRHEAVEPLSMLRAGKHTIEARVHHVGVTTRMLPAQRPFFACEAEIGEKPIEIVWKAALLPAYASQVRRINPQLGWIEWCDTRQLPVADNAWKPVKVIDLGAVQFIAARISGVEQLSHPLSAFSEDKLIERFGYERDDIPARFFQRDLQPQTLPPQGIWRRYDLDRVRLGRLAVTIDCPAGAVVEIAYAESLTDGRVAPYINLSAGPSCNLDHYIARGGVQEFCALTPKGGRFVEVHVLADPSKTKFVSAKYLERTYHDWPKGSFECDDPLLNRIWLAGVETYRACSEDAIIDNPTRERGQWTGDAVIGMETASVAYDDLRVARRALVCAAQAARGDGLVSGLTPGNSPMSSYAAQWVSACMRYHQLSGDKTLLEELFDPAVKNLSAFEPFLKPEGLVDGLGWAFIDWGYARPEGPIDPALNFHYLNALRAMIAWCQRLKRPDDHYTKLADQLQNTLTQYLAKSDWEKLGYHVTALALGAGLIDEKQKPIAIAFVRKHILNCFPNNPDAPRLSDPGVTSRQLITPYFAHFLFPSLLRNGEADFVLDQYRKCWGWMLSEGRTTILEVFDPRWSHCHQWAACPTWQLSRFVLGLHPRGDRVSGSFDLDLRPGSLKRASGRVPMIGGTIEVTWERRGNRIAYTLSPWEEIEVRHGSELLEIDKRTELMLDIA